MELEPILRSVLFNASFGDPCIIFGSSIYNGFYMWRYRLRNHASSVVIPSVHHIVC